MDQTAKALWLTALRSDEYKQTSGALNDDSGYCCLGVLCEVAITAGVPVTKVPASNGSSDFYFDGEAGLPPYSVKRWAGLVDSNPLVSIDGELVGLAALNDGNPDEGVTRPYSFAEIADLIAAEL